MVSRLILHLLFLLQTSRCQIPRWITTITAWKLSSSNLLLINSQLRISSLEPPQQVIPSRQQQTAMQWVLLAILSGQVHQWWVQVHHSSIIQLHLTMGAVFRLTILVDSINSKGSIRGGTQQHKWILSFKCKIHRCLSSKSILSILQEITGETLLCQVNLLKQQVIILEIKISFSWAGVKSSRRWIITMIHYSSQKEQCTEAIEIFE
jgi:hypothetical protein